MGAIDLELSRISKLFVDRDQTTTDAALARRQEFAVTLLCGDDVAGSYTLQLALLTAASIAVRCFPGAVRAVVPVKLADAPLLIWPQLKLTFGQALRDLLGPEARFGDGDPAAHGLVFGNAAADKGALRVTFDGWIAKVGPAVQTPRLPERDTCPLAGTLAGALALSELFLTFADISVEATRRTVGLSLWRPDLNIGNPGALGVPVEYLPRELWVLGLGHLGNAYLWALAGLPYATPEEVTFSLCDFDKVEPENVETGVILTAADERRLKTRAASGWLERRGFQTRLVERRFDASFRRHEGEPGLALCGFDSNAARRDLATAQFLRVVESGLGGTANNFDTISLHTLPNPRTPAELWPELGKDDEERSVAHQKRMARENPGYTRLGKDDCGRFDLAGKSVAVPFVGVAAGSLVVAEALRLLHGGPAFADIKLSLGRPDKLTARLHASYSAQDAVGIKFVNADCKQKDTP
jgi:molybdopterin/thiamine biosynthesis adenylyltransferase